MSDRRNGSGAVTQHQSTGLLKEQAYTTIKQRILSGQYAPGSFLAERQLADDLGMSKTPVKSALERLEHEGFITVSPQQGILVRSMSVSEIADQYEIRIALESFTVRTLAGRLAADQIGQLQLNLLAQKRSNAQQSVETAVRLDSEFHQLFAQFLGNEEILRVMNQLRDKMRLVIATVFQTHPMRSQGSYAEHTAIAEAVIQGHGTVAAKLIEDHLEYGKTLILTRRPRT